MALKAALLSMTEAVGLSALADRATRRQLRILCYHGLWTVPGSGFGNCLFMPPEQFDARMARLKRSGRPVLGLEEAVTRLAADTLPHGAVVVTIDDGWASTFSHMLPTLERYELPATLYVTSWYAQHDLPVINVAVDYLHAQAARGDLDRDAVIARIERLPRVDRLGALREHGRALGVGEGWLEHRQFHLMRPDELADAARRGLDLQLHTHRHIDVTAQAHRLPQEIAENRAFLARVTGAMPATHFCYPSGTYHSEAPGLLAATGVTSATLIDEGLNAPGADPMRLRRFLDGRTIDVRVFDAYLSGALHCLDALRGRRAPRPAPRVARTATDAPLRSALG